MSWLGDDVTLMNSTEHKDCGGCFWEGVCTFERPCHYYISSERVEDMEERALRRRRLKFLEEWNEYIEYIDDDNVIF